MPGMLIKEVPEELHRRLKERAAANRRSLSREVLVMLETAMAEPAGPPTLEEVDRLRVAGARPLTQDLLDRARAAGRP
jgi:plasmid stability protein